MTRRHTQLALLFTALSAITGCSDEADETLPAEPPRAATPAPCAPPPTAAAPQQASAAPTVAIPTPAPAPPTRIDHDDADEDAPLRVKRLLLARGVEKREPVGPAASFTLADERIYAFVEVANLDAAESAVLVSFAKQGKPESGAVRLRVGPSARWRTWAFTRQADEPGDYQVIVRNLKGEELGRAPFTVAQPEPAPAPQPAS